MKKITDKGRKRGPVDPKPKRMPANGRPVAMPIPSKAKKPAKGPEAQTTGKGNFHTRAKALGVDVSAKPAKPLPPVLMEISADIELLPADRGRPTTLTTELGSRVCTLYAQGESLEEMETHDGLPHARTVYRWLAAPNVGARGPLYEAFRQTFARAKELRSHTRLGKIETVLRRVAATKQEIEAGIVQPIHHAAARVVIDGQQALMALENRRDYGKHLTLASDPKNPIVPATRFDLSEDELLAIAAKRQVDNATDE